jgi:hypothetical protein
VTEEKKTKKQSGDKPAKSASASLPYRIPASSPWANAWKILGGVGVACLGAAGAMSSSDPKRFAFSYLFAFYVFLTIALGSLFFVLVQHLTAAGWSVTVRRSAELLASGLVVFVVLVAPIVVGMRSLYPWLDHGAGAHGAHGAEHTSLSIVGEAHAQDAPQEPGKEPTRGAQQGGGHGAGTSAGGGHGQHGHGKKMEPGAGAGAAPEHAGGGFKVLTQEEAMEEANHLAHAETIAKKAPYLNKSFFLARAVLYVLLWAFLATRLLGYSTSQDKTKDPKTTLAVQRFSAPATILFALSLTFAAFDWLMSLEPTWFSTIFGVNIFASSVVSSLAVLILLTMSMRQSGLIKDEINVEHYHDLGKLTFGFLVFWAYISFSQLMLIWYAALPEETTFYHHRWDSEPWRTISVLLIVGHFIMPFFGIMSRNFKRRLAILRFWVMWILVMHVVQMYWFVMPYVSASQATPGATEAGFAFHYFDALCLVGVGGVYLGFVLYQMTKHALIPVGDPRLERALRFENA